MPISDQPPIYRSYLLRFWEERGEQPALRVWRCSLEDAQTGRRHGFADLAALTTWLSAELEQPGSRPAGTFGDRAP